MIEVMAATAMPADNAGMQGHGEYKMPGGKLVVADVAIEHGRLAQVALSGDFFLEPDEALDAINAALAGQGADADVDVLAAVVQAALPAQVRMYGISADAVAVAVRRAIDAAEAA
ncbi:biotin--protein ligase [Thermomonas fusca]|uniref:biotin--protein ligase n=2 Tax=Thermomonas TaxID=141948 RepID=UPI00040DFB84|nr:biotin--protein ligase [Thermomonas fusca]